MVAWNSHIIIFGDVDISLWLIHEINITIIFNQLAFYCLRLNNFRKIG